VREIPWHDHHIIFLWLERTQGSWELPKGIAEFEGKLELGKFLLQIWMGVWKGSKGFFCWEILKQSRI
jgi:hypothetical protein